MRLLLLSSATNAKFEGICFEAGKKMHQVTMGNSQLHSLILMHVHENILDNIDLTDVVLILLKEKAAPNIFFGNESVATTRV